MFVLVDVKTKLQITINKRYLRFSAILETVYVLTLYIMVYALL